MQVSENRQKEMFVTFRSCRDIYPQNFSVFIRKYFSCTSIPYPFSSFFGNNVPTVMRPIAPHLALHRYEDYSNLYSSQRDGVTLGGVTHDVTAAT